MITVVEDPLFLECEVVLAENRKAFARPKDDASLVRLQLSGKYFQEGRLAGAIGADEAVAVPGGELQSRRL